jgi:glycosyltransferase involved in cell wall biosynthesis
MKRIPIDKQIVFINQSSGYLMVDIINQFSEDGYQCDLITGLLVERNRPLSKQVRVRRIIRYNNITPIKRVFTWGWGTIQIFLLVLLRYRKAHLFIVSNPPMAALIPQILPNSFSLLIYDVYPDAITELGILKKKSLIIKIWEKANQRVYLRAKDIFTITQGMKDLLRSYASDKNVEIVPLWADNEFLCRIPTEENIFIQSYCLEGRFVVLYSGNIGVSNDVEVLAEVAKLVYNENVRFVIIGDGAKKRHLEDKVINEKLKNIIILPWQDVKYLPYTLSAANIGVVTLGKGASKLAIPSKIFSLLSVGVPILSIAARDSDLSNFIEFHKAGKCFLPEEIEEMAQYIMTLAENPKKCEDISNNSLHASYLFTRKNAISFVQNHIDI